MVFHRFNKFIFIEDMSEMNKEMTSLLEVGDAVLMSNDPNFDKGHLQVTSEGRKYKTTLTKKFLERKTWKAPDPNEIISHIPGEVSSIMVKEGDTVAKGDKLMIYEAMKMKNIITAPFDAEVLKIAVKQGEKLPKGALLVKLSATNK